MVCGHILSYGAVVCSSVAIETAVVAIQTLMCFGMTDMACCGHKPFAPGLGWVVGEAYLFMACSACHDHWSSCGAEMLLFVYLRAGWVMVVLLVM